MNTFNGPITGLEMAEKRISELKNMTMEYSENRKAKKKKIGKSNNIPKLGQLQKT